MRRWEIAQAVLSETIARALWALLMCGWVWLVAWLANPSVTSGDVWLIGWCVGLITWQIPTGQKIWRKK